MSFHFISCDDPKTLLKKAKIKGIGKKYIIKLCKTKGESFLLKDDYTFINLNLGYYVFEVKIYIKFACPIRKTNLYLLDLTDINNIRVISTILVSNEIETTMIVEENLKVAGEFAYVLDDSPDICGFVNFAMEGNFSLSEKRVELAKVTAFDQALKIKYIPSRPVSLPNPPFPGQYPPGAEYPWSSTVIPSTIVPEPKPATLPDRDGYKKFQSVQYSIGFYLGLDMATIDPKDPQLSVFLTNLEDRGNDNYRKKVYMTALTTNIMENYSEKIDIFLNETLAGFITYGKPVLSSFKTSLINFFLAIHIGYDQYPDYVFKYFETFIDIIGFGDPNRPGRDEAMIFGNSVVGKVREYFAARNNIIKDSGDKTTLLHYWHQAGLAAEGLVMEAIHNIIAFSQFNNTLFVLIRDKVKGTPNPLPVDLKLPPPFDYVKGPAISYNFFKRLVAAPTEKDKLNVVREVYRLLVPNNTSFSRVEQTDFDSKITIQSRHLHQLIMVNNTPALGPIPGNVAYFIYNPTLYNNFETDFSIDVCPIVPKIPTSNDNPQGNFIKSPVDNETLLDKCNPKMIPVYPVPLYTPFGLGYRRCPGEIFNYFITIKMIEKYASVNFYFIEPVPLGTKLVTLAPFFAAPDNIYATGP